MQRQGSKSNGKSQLNGVSQSNGTELCSNGQSCVRNSHEKSKVCTLSEKDQEMIRLIGQHLQNIGMKKSADVLMDESSCPLDHPAASRFKKNVLAGDWINAEIDLTDLESLLENSNDMRYLLVEQKYLELLDEGSTMEALACLRSQLTPLAKQMERVHQLSSLMFMPDTDELRKAADWRGAGVESREELMSKLQKYLPPSIMLPPKRLEILITQAVEYQKTQCPYHNTRPENKFNIGVDSLLTDHTCPRHSFPFCEIQTISDHCDEVWMARFSPNGLKLATGSKDSALIIWDINPESFSITRRFNLDGHNYGVVYLSWSPDSSKIIMCLHDEASELLVYDAITGTLVCRVHNAPEDSLTCAAWHKDSKKFVCGGIKGQFFLCNLEGQILESWEGVRVQCLGYLPDGKTVLAADTHHRIRGYQLEDVNDFNVIQEDQSIMSFTLDSSGRYALLNVASQGVHLWDIHSKTLVRKFRGLTQGHYTIHSCFGGENEDFIASGSEDHKVYIWNRSKETPVASLSGHTRTVNCATWNPVFTNMLVSVSDDATIRIWGPSEVCRKNSMSFQSNVAESSENGELVARPTLPSVYNVMYGLMGAYFMILISYLSQINLFHCLSTILAAVLLAFTYVTFPHTIDKIGICIIVLMSAIFYLLSFIFSEPIDPSTDPEGYIVPSYPFYVSLVLSLNILFNYLIIIDFMPSPFYNWSTV